jgi:hypothetical protein
MPFPLLVDVVEAAVGQLVADPQRQLEVLVLRDVDRSASDGGHGQAVGARMPECGQEGGADRTSGAGQLHGSLLGWWTNELRAGSTQQSAAPYESPT